MNVSEMAGHDVRIFCKALYKVACTRSVKMLQILLLTYLHAC